MKKDANTEYTSIMGDSTVGETPLSSPMPKSKKSISSMWKPIVIVALAVVVFLAAFFGVGLYFEKKSQQDEEEAYNKEPKAGMTYFVAEESEPEKSATELTSLITEAYYTNDGSLAIRFCFANGMPEAQRLLSVEVKLRNGEGVTVATGYSDDIKKGYTIPSGGTNTLLLYVSPEYVQITDDPLSTIDYDVTTEYEVA